MHAQTPPGPMTTTSALLALAAVNALLWVLLARAIGGIVGLPPSAPVLAALAIGTGLAVLVPTALRLPSVTRDVPGDQGPTSA